MRSPHVTVKSNGAARHAESEELTLAMGIRYVCLVCFLLRRDTGDEHTTCQRLIHRWNKVTIH
jgi:hypothetical protein